MNCTVHYVNMNKYVNKSLSVTYWVAGGAGAQ